MERSQKAPCLGKSGWEQELVQGEQWIYLLASTGQFSMFTAAGGESVHGSRATLCSWVLHSPTALPQTLAFSVHSQQVTLVKALWCTWNMWRGSWQPCRYLTQKSTESNLKRNSTLHVLRADTPVLVAATKLNQTVNKIPDRFLSNTSLTSSGGAKAPLTILVIS